MSSLREIEKKISDLEKSNKELKKKLLGSCNLIDEMRLLIDWDMDDAETLKKACEYIEMGKDADA